MCFVKKTSTRIWLYNYVHTFKLINITILLILSILQALTSSNGEAQKTLSNHRNIDFTTCTYYKNFYYTRQYCLPKVIFVYQQISFPLRIFLDTIYSANFPSFPAIRIIVNRITFIDGLDIPFSCLHKGRLTMDNNRQTLQSSLRFTIFYCMLIVINSGYNYD